LKPLSPKEINKDQIKMKQKRKYEKDEENNKIEIITSQKHGENGNVDPSKINTIGSLR